MMLTYNRTLKIFFIVVCLISSTFFCNAAAQTPETVVEKDTLQSVVESGDFNSSFDAFTLFLKTVGFLILLGILLYFFLQWYKKSVYGKSFNKYSSEMKLLGAMNIAPKKSICMVNVLDHVLVLGLTENDINLLLDIPEAEIGERLKQKLQEEEKEQPQNFGKILNQWMKKNTA